MICEVIVDIAHSEVDKIFDYVCDESVQAGARVTVPVPHPTSAPRVFGAIARTFPTTRSAHRSPVFPISFS